MKKISFLLMLAGFLFASDININVCGLFTNVLQTRKEGSKIKMNGEAHIINTPSCYLNTGSIEPNSNGKVLICDKSHQKAKATGKYGSSLNNKIFTWEFDDSHASEKLKGGNSYTVKKSGDILTKDKYKNIKQDEHHYSFIWSPSGNDISVYKFDNILGTVTIDNVKNKDVKIGQIVIPDYGSTEIKFTQIPSKIEIGKVDVKNGSNSFDANWEAKESIDITEMDIKSSVENDITLSAPIIRIGNENKNKVDLSNSNNHHIIIYADKLYIGEIDFGQNDILEIHPYTPGKKVEVYIRSVDFSSNSQIIMDSGNYHIKDINIPEGGSGKSLMKASNENQVINLMVDPTNKNHDFEIGSNFGINSNGTNGNFGNYNPVNFRIFVNGDFETKGGGTTINALVYVMGEVDLGSPTYIRGAISSYNNIEISNGSKFYWPDGMENKDFAKECKINHTVYKDDYQDFKLIHQENIFGNIISVGNTNECVTAKKAVNNINELKSALCENNVSKYYNNYYMTKYINIMDKNTSIFNASSATIKFPNTFKKIKYAAIFWQGHINNYSYQYSNTANRKKSYDKYYYESWDKDNKTFKEWRKNNGSYYYNLSNDLYGNTPDGIKKTPANEIVAFFNGKTVNLSAKELDYKSDSRYFYDATKKKNITKYGVKYSAYTEIDPKLLNSLVKNNELNITVANIFSTYGLDFKLGDYAGWSIVIIYEEDSQNPNSKLRSNSVYYGFKNLSKDNKNLDINIKHLLFPRYGKIDSKLSIFTAEGEYKNKGTNTYRESVYVNNHILSNFYKEVKAKDGHQAGVTILKNYDNSNNVMDSILSDFERKPYLADNNGIDIDNFDVSNALTDYRDKHKIINGDYDITIHLSTYHDGYFVSEISFANELYQPRVCYYIDTITDSNGKIIYKNGKFLDKINTLRDYNISFWIANMKQNENDNAIDTADKVKLTLQYDNFKYIPNSTYVKNIGDNNFKFITDESGDDIGEFLGDKNQTILRIGKGANAVTGGEIKPTFNFNNDKNKVFGSIKGRFLANSDKTIDLENYLQYMASFQTPYINITTPVRIPKCKKFNTQGKIYNPPIGTFNVVSEKFEGNIDPIDHNDPLNALYTQVVNKPFDVKILHLGEDKKTLSNYIGIVRVDLIKTPTDDNLSKLNLNNLEILDTKYIFFPNLKEVNTKNTFPLRASFVSSKAVKNADFLIRYLTYDNKYPVNWTCMTKTKSCIWTMIKDIYSCSNIANCPCKNQCMPSFEKSNQLASEQCLECLFNSPKVSYVLSRDNFAIRPYAFRVFGDNQYKRAGEDFNLIIKAVDKDNNNLDSGDVNDVKGVTDYNEPLNNLNISSKFYVPTDAETRQMNKDVYNIDDTNRSRVAYCPYPGTFSVIGNPSFSDGEVNTTLEFSETGVLEVNVSEKPGSEFAKVDEKDTPDNERYIKPATIIFDKNDINKTDLLMFIPYKFETNGYVDTIPTNPNSWVYISNEVNKSNSTYKIPKMAGLVIYKITAYNKEGKVVRNYTKTCFPDVNEIHAPRKNGLKLNTTFDLFLDTDLNITKDAVTSFYTADNDGNYIWTMNTKKDLTKGKNLVKEWIGATNFENGEGIAKVYFNINKNYKVPTEEINITINDINTSTSWMYNPGATNIFKGKSINKTLIFKYGRIHVKEAIGTGNEVNTTYKYEYWDKNKGWIVNKDHNTTFGMVDLDNSYVNGISLKEFSKIKYYPNNIKNGEQNITFKTNHSLPYSVKIHLAIPDWLWYHPLAKPYEAPSKTNQDCLTHPCTKVTFLGNSVGWGGIEANSTVIKKEFNVSKRTIEINSSKKSNVTKKEVKKINW